MQDVVYLLYSQAQSYFTHKLNTRMEDYKIIRHSDIVNLFIHRKELCRSFTVEEHTVMHVHNGAIDIKGENGSITITAGQSAFIRRNHRVSISRHPGPDGTDHQSMAFNIPKKFLMRVYDSLKDELASYPETDMVGNLTFLPERPDLSSFFGSFLPFYTTEADPDAQWLEMKFREGIHILLQAAPEIHTALFDFKSQWKIDILPFMEDNFRYDLSIAQLAHYTGRSLASFKRDFKKVSDLTPERWLLRRRLEEAHKMLCRGGCSVTEVSNECGFSSLSYFSRVYKDAYGVSPATVLKGNG